MSDKQKVIRIEPPPGEVYGRFMMADIKLPSKKEREERDRLEREGKVPPMIWDWKPEKDVASGKR